MDGLPQYSKGQEIANSITHGIGIVLSVTGLVALVVMASLHGTVWHIVSFSIYGPSLVLLYTSSTLYHSFRPPRVKRVFRIIDHSSIYVLIAGSYTPFLLVNLRGVWGWSLFGIAWGISLAGIIVKTFFTGRFKIMSTIFYLFMGWMIVIAIKPLAQAIPIAGIGWLLTGGLAYTAGAIFYLWKDLPYHHAIWHLFILAASVCHYFAILFYVLPARV
jgi:hemolysin III